MIGVFAARIASSALSVMQLTADHHAWQDQEVTVCGYRSMFKNVLLDQPDSDMTNSRTAVYIDPELTVNAKRGDRLCVAAVLIRADGLSKKTIQEKGLGEPWTSHGPIFFALRPTRYLKVDEKDRSISLMFVRDKRKTEPQGVLRLGGCSTAGEDAFARWHRPVRSSPHQQPQGPHLAYRKERDRRSLGHPSP